MITRCFSCFQKPDTYANAAASCKVDAQRSQTRAELRQAAQCAGEPLPFRVDPSPTASTLTGPALVSGAKRLSRSLRAFNRTTQTTRWCHIVPRGDSLYRWDVAFHYTSGPMHDSLLEHKIDHLKLEVTFPPEYPVRAPAIRVVSPQISRLRNFSVSGGALCIKLLYEWDPVTHEETLLATIHALLANAAVAKNESYTRDAYERGHRKFRKNHRSWKT